MYIKVVCIKCFRKTPTGIQTILGIERSSQARVPKGAESIRCPKERSFWRISCSRGTSWSHLSVPTTWRSASVPPRCLVPVCYCWRAGHSGRDSSCWHLICAGHKEALADLWDNYMRGKEILAALYMRIVMAKKRHQVIFHLFQERTNNVVILVVFFQRVSLKASL